MKAANRAVVETYEETIDIYKGFNDELKSLKGLVGKPGQRRSHNNLKRLGAALLLAPTPEPITDIIGLALIGAGEIGERFGPPLTICELDQERQDVLSDLQYYADLYRKRLPLGSQFLKG